MTKKKAILLSITILFIGLIITAGSYAFWSWSSNSNKNIVFNTAKELRNYVIYDEGESKFIGDFNISTSYTDGIHTTISLYKTSEAANVDLLATIYMDINSIGNAMKESTALKWTVTEGDDQEIGSILAEGNFIGANSGDILTLVPNIEVTTTLTKYTVWIWIDQNDNPSDDLTGETLDTNVWTEINQVEGIDSVYQITRINASYQTISATVVNNKNKIVKYAVTTTNNEPSSNSNDWVEIAQNKQSNTYNLTTTVNTIGTYYVWFMDEEEQVVNAEIEVEDIDTTGPVCTFGSWNKAHIENSEIAQITLTCTDTGSTITNHNLTISDFTLSNDYITLTNILKTSVANGYSYQITVTGTIDDGSTTVTLPENKVKNATHVGNASVTSSAITVQNDTQGPIITLGQNLSSTYENQHEIDVTITDTYSGIKSGANVKYGWSLSNTVQPDSYTNVTLSYSEGDPTTGFTAVGDSMNGEYYLWVVPLTLQDTINNSTTTPVVSTGTFKFDNDTMTVPTISFESNAVTNGLVYGFDGRNNTGNGHSNTATIWNNYGSLSTNGTISGPTWGDNYLEFDGTDDGVILSQINNTNYTLEIALSASDLSKTQYNVFNNFETYGIGIIIYNKKIELYANINSTGYSVVSKAIETNRIYFVSASYDGSTMKLYVDGILISSKSVTGDVTVPNSNTVFAIGCNPAGSSCENGDSRYFNGKIYSARLYNRALSLSEIRQNYAMDKLSVGEYATGAPNFTLSGGTSQLGIGGYQYAINSLDTFTAYNSTSKPTVTTDGVNNVSGRVINTHSISGPVETDEIKLDNTPPTGNLAITSNGSSLQVDVAVTDALSGSKNLYGYKVSTSSTCSSSTTGFVNSESNTYNFTITSAGLHYVCVRILDNAGNYNYISKVAPANYFEYTGSPQTFTATESGYYKAETWGAQGGGDGGKGAYVSGYINLAENDPLYVYVGGVGEASTSSGNAGGYNGGGGGGYNESYYGFGGGGATDIRLSNEAIEPENFVSRIMVAAGGGAGYSPTTTYTYVAGDGGDLVGKSGGGTFSNSNTAATDITTGGAQSSGGVGNYGTSFNGSFGYANQNIRGSFGGGGGGGWYGGACGYGKGGAGGSSFISGYAGVRNADPASYNCSNGVCNVGAYLTTAHNSGKFFIDNQMTAGENTGAGKAKITYVGDTHTKLNTKLDNVRYIKDCINGNNTNGWNGWVEVQAINNGDNVAVNKSVTGITNHATYCGPVSNITDSEIHYDSCTNSSTGNSYDNECIVIDLMDNYNLDEVAVWHYWKDGRIYNNNITYVSSNNTNWTEVIRDNKPETSNGKRASAYKEYANISYYANNFGAAASGTTSGVTYTYNAETSELTLNGTFTTQTLLLGKVTDMNIMSGDKYTTKMTYVSGSYTTTSTDVGILTDLTLSDGRFSDRATDPKSYHYVRCPSSGTNSKTLTVAGSRKDADGLHFRLYQTTSNTTTFTNYKIKVEVVKDEGYIIPVGENYILPSNPVRYDQNFNGWYTEDGTKIKTSSIVNIAGDQTIYANWGNNKLYSLTYDLAGGSVSQSNPTSYKANTSTITLNNPTKTGNTFNGWTEQIVNLDWEEGFINVNTGEIGTSSTYPNSYYSEFISLKSGVTYTINTDYSSGLRWRVYDTNEVYLENISTTTYTPSQNVKVRLLFYQGPTSAQMNSTVINADTQLTTQTIPVGSMGNRKYTAHWTANTYTINYYQGNGTSTAGSTKIGSSTCTYGQSCTLKTYANLGATFPESSSSNYISSNTCSHGWAFYGWSATQTGTARTYTNGQTFTYNTAGNMSIYAIGYRSIRFSTGQAPTSYETGYAPYQYWNPYSTSSTYLTSVMVPDPALIAISSSGTDWTFVGYKAGSSDAVAGTTYAASTVGTSVKPAFDTCKYMRSLYSRTLTINYQANGGSGSTSATTATQYYNSGYADGGSNYGAKVSTPSFTLRSNGFTAPSGRSFDKWADGSTSGAQYAAGASYNAWSPAVENTTITKNMYAIWKGNTYTINYYQGNGTSTAGSTKIGSSTCTYGQSCTLKTYANLSATFPESSSANNTSSNTCDHYWTFNAWSTSQTGTTTAYTNGQTFTYNLASNLNLYATGYKYYYFSVGNTPTSYGTGYSAFQLWNPYSTSTNYMTSITIPAGTAINTWTFLGYKAGNSDATSGTTYAANTVGTSVKPAYDTCRFMRSLYSRTLTINYQANGGSGTTSATTSTQYYNSGYASGGTNYGAKVSTPSFTLRANGFTAPSGKIFSKWADGSTSGTQYAAGASYSAWSPAVGNTTITKNMYAIWISQFSFSYTGKYKVCYGTNYGTCTSERTNNSYEISSKPWKVNFLTSGTLTVSGINGKVDAFLVGGGGGGGTGGKGSYDITISCSGNGCLYATYFMYTGGAGGGGGNTKTQTGITLSTTTYSITIGAGGAGGSAGSIGTTGGTTSAFGYSATGGIGGHGKSTVGTGTGSGGKGGNGGSDAGVAGGDGVYAFGSSSVDSTKYGGGGGGGAGKDNGVEGTAGSGGASGGAAGGICGTVGNNGTANTGGGGGGGGGRDNTENGYDGGTGGSGIVIIKNNS